MPIVDVERVCAPGEPRAAVSTRALADAVGQAIGSPPGHTWVRLRDLPVDAYAENGVDLDPTLRPVFVRVLHARSPTGAARAEEAGRLTLAVAACLGLPPERVHVEYAPDGAGRMAFGGRILD